MSTNLRKAQKHMQRAKELLNQSQPGFGAPNPGPSLVGPHRPKHRQRADGPYEQRPKTKKGILVSSACSDVYFNKQQEGEGTCYMHAALGLIVKSLYKDTKMFDKHKKIARITFPIWLYIAVTGVVVYLMISPYYIH